MNWGIDPATGRQVPCNNQGHTFLHSDPWWVMPIFSEQR